MTDIWNDPEWKAFAARISDELYPMLSNSAMTVSIAPEEADVKFAVELGLSVMMNKPIIIVVPFGRTIPDKLRQVADGVVEGDFKDPDFQEKLYAEIERIRPSDG